MAESSPDRAPRILLADDNADNVALIALYLEDLPYRLETAANGLEAQALHAAAPPDLIFMDLEMPVRDGYEATRAIRHHERAQGLRPVPILALTAHAMDEHRERCLAAGFTDFLVKPVRKAAILAALDRYLTPAAGQPRTAPPAAGPDPLRLRPLLPLFYATCAETLAQANQALALGDLEAARGCGHKLKGAARSYGFWDLGLSGENLERSAGEGNARGAVEALRQARRQLEQARQLTEGERCG